jgi:hypothetical protein
MNGIVRLTEYQSPEEKEASATIPSDFNKLLET